MKELIAIQAELKVLKQNSKPELKFKYRTCEEIFQEVKPICINHGVLLTVSDEVELHGERYYIKAIATVQKDGVSISASGLAREPEKLMSMSYPQITGSCSSYARKTAMGGLFAIDNNADPDSGKGEDEIKKASDQQIKILNDYLPLLEKNFPDKYSYLKKSLESEMFEEDAKGLIEKCAIYTGVKK